MPRHYDEDRFNPFARPSNLISDVQSFLPQSDLPNPDISSILPESTSNLAGVAGLNISPTGGRQLPGGGLTPEGFTGGRPLTGNRLDTDRFTGDGEFDITKQQEPEPVQTPQVQEQDILADFMSKLTSLSESQQSLLLGFIQGGGVDAEEYAQLFNIDPKFSFRFQGLPSLSNLEDQLKNIEAFREQRTGFELQSARQAALSEAAGGAGAGLGFGALGRGFSGFGQRGLAGGLQRSQLRGLLQQRMASVGEQTAGKYSQLISAITGQLGEGFRAAGDILQEDPEARQTQSPSYNRAILQANHYFKTTPDSGRDINWRPAVYDELTDFQKKEFDMWWASQFQIEG